MREQHGPMKDQPGPTREKHVHNRLRFGNYDLVRRIDVGGMGEVYLARQRTAFDREVAIKIIRADLVHDPIARKRFLREAEVNAHLKHEHILPLFEFGEEQGRLFLVTPYIEGGTLAQRLQSGPIPLSEVRTLFSALVKAVAYIHRRGVIHRDLKPTNILLDREANTNEVYVRLIDFGIATIQGMTASPPLTTAGNEMGTAAYMAPERLSGVAAPSNDIYSLGVILYQMLTGMLPSGKQRASLPPPLAYVVDRCLADNPDERFRSADELLQAFEYACKQLLSAELDGQQMVIPVMEDLPENPSTVRKTTNPRVKTLHDTGGVPAVSQQSGPSRAMPRFDHQDYSAPTVNIGNLSNKGNKAVLDPSPAVVPVSRPPQKKQRKNPILAVVTILIVLILLIMASLFFVEFQSFTLVTATINLSPRIQTVQQVFHVSAQPNQAKINPANSTISAHILPITKTGQQTGPTTGRHCVLGIFNCKQAVDVADVEQLSAQLKQTLEAEIKTALQKQIQSAGGTAVSGMQFTDISQSSNPDIGAESPTVTVSLQEQGAVEYIVGSDAQKLADQLLTAQVQKLGPDYSLLTSSVQVGQPAIRGIDNNGVVSIDVAAAGLAEYRFPASQLTSMQKHLKGMKLKAGLSFLKAQNGVDANSVAIHLNTGDTLPDNVQQIKIVPVAPGTFPPVIVPAITPGITPPVGTTSGG